MDSINDILASLTPDDINALRETAEALFGSGGFNPPPQSSTPPPSSSDGFDFGKLDPGMFARLSDIMSAMNSDGGKRCRLIEALKPNLSPYRQKKADEAMQILKLMDVFPLIQSLMKRDEQP